MKDWYKIKPELFKKQPYNLPGCDIYVPSERMRLLLAAFLAGDDTDDTYKK